MKMEIIIVLHLVGLLLNSFLSFYYTKISRMTMYKLFEIKLMSYFILDHQI